MAIPQNKAALLHAIQLEYKKLCSEIAQIPPESVLHPTMLGHVKDSKMSPHNLIAYLLGWNELILKWNQNMKSGETVYFPEFGFKWNELGLLAKKFYKDYEDIPFESLVLQLHTAKDQIVDLVESHDNDELYGRPRYREWPLGRMIQFNTSSPYANACGRLRKWRKLHFA